MHLFVTLELKGIQCYLRKSLNNRNRVSSPEWPKICFLIKEYELGFFYSILARYVGLSNIDTLAQYIRLIDIYFISFLFSFDFCTTDESESPVENLGQVVFGERIRPSPYKASWPFSFWDKYKSHASVCTYYIFVLHSRVISSFHAVA